MQTQRQWAHEKLELHQETKRKKKQVDYTLTIPSNPSTPQAPTLPNIRPKPTPHTPTRDDNAQYSVTSNGTQKRHLDQVRVAHADTTGHPHFNAHSTSHTDATEWEATPRHKAKYRAFDRIGVLEVLRLMPRLESRKATRR
jgi:hypothetical protein